jgi:hypothetical protein
LKKISSPLKSIVYSNIMEDVESESEESSDENKQMKSMVNIKDK